MVVVRDDLLVRLGLEEGAAVPLAYPYDPTAYNSAVYLLTPEAYGMLLHRPTGEWGDSVLFGMNCEMSFNAYL